MYEQLTKEKASHKLTNTQLEDAKRHNEMLSVNNSSLNKQMETLTP